MSNECIHTHSNLAKYGIWSIDCEIWDMGYWGVKHLGYGILGVKNLGYGILGGKKSGIWDMGTPVSPPQLLRNINYSRNYLCVRDHDAQYQC